VRPFLPFVILVTIARAPENTSTVSPVLLRAISPTKRGAQAPDWAPASAPIPPGRLPVHDAWLCPAPAQGLLANGTKVILGYYKSNPAV
jgi:hypothetical protein